MIKWLRNEFTKTPGYMRVNLSLLMILATSSVLSTGSLISRQVNSTSVENISTKNESLKVEKEESHQSQTGEDITEALMNLNKTLEEWAERISKEKSSQSIPPQVESIMKRLDSSSQEEF